MIKSEIAAAQFPGAINAATKIAHGERHSAMKPSSAEGILLSRETHTTSSFCLDVWAKILRVERTILTDEDLIVKR